MYYFPLSKAMIMKTIHLFVDGLKEKRYLPSQNRAPTVYSVHAHTQTP